MRALSRGIALASAGALALTLAACAPGNGNRTSPAPADGQTQSEINKDPATMGDIALTVWDQEVRSGQADQFTKLIDAFTAKYPNITIERNEQAFDDLTTTLGLALSDPNPPDVVQANNGRSDMGTFVKAGQLVDMTDYAAAYGWTDRFPETVLKNMRYTSDGAEFGSGNLYGLPQMGEIVGVYYNKEKLADLGLAIPTSWNDFVDSLKTAKDGGETPLILGNLEGWPAAHVFGPIQGALVDSGQIIDLGMGNPGANWETPENTAAAQLLADWSENGYFNEGFAGANDQDAAQQFAKGTGLYLMAGSWNTAALDEAMGENVGFFAPPPPGAAGDPIATTGGTSLPFAIPTGSKNHDAAAAFIDFITNEDAMKTVADAGNIPAIDSAELAPASGVMADVFAAYDEVSTKGVLLPYLDWATPTFGDDALIPGLQGLLAGQTSPDDMLASFEKDYAAFTS